MKFYIYTLDLPMKESKSLKFQEVEPNKVDLKNEGL